jgi:methylmalonyl-CoA mutase cobalamin-binding subunit
MRTMSDDEIDRLGHAIAAEGLDRHEAGIERIARLAAAAGASEAVLAVLTDAAAPEVARNRALSRAVAAIRGCRTNPEVALVA